jgi:hypothetical protein
MENSIKVLQKIKNGTHMLSSHLIPRYTSKEMKKAFQRQICTPVFFEALFPTAEIWKQLKCPSLDE